LGGRAVRLHELDVFTPVVTDGWDEGPTEPNWLTGREVGEYVATVLAPGFPRGKSLFLSIPDRGPRTAAQTELNNLS
jgi:hypothetical protein